MLVKIQFSLFIVLTFYECSAEIIMAQAVIRHSNRNPEVAPAENLYYPNDPYANYSWPPYGPLELTDTGRVNAYYYGKTIRKLYRNLLHSTIDESVSFRSGNMSRSIMTAELIAYGLTPFHRRGKLGDQSSTIEIEVKSQATDVLFYGPYVCNNYNVDRNKAIAKTGRILSAIKEAREYFDYLTLHTGANHTTTEQSYRLYLQLHARLKLNVALPEWSKAIFPNGKLEEMTAIEYILRSSNTRMKRLNGGLWIKEWLDNVDRVLNGSVTQRLFIYTGNDIQAAGILNALGAYQMQLPEFIATIFFELHKLDNNYYVKAIFRNVGQSQDILVFGCSNVLCPLEVFKEKLKKVIPVNVDKECGKRINKHFY